MWPAGPHRRTHREEQPWETHSQQWVTVDNIAAEEDGGLSFVSGEPFSESTNKAFKASVMGLIDSVDTMILGANTYAQSKGYARNHRQSVLANLPGREPVPLDRPGGNEARAGAIDADTP